MKSIERRADAERIGGMSGDAGSEVRGVPHLNCGAKAGRGPVEQRMVGLAAEVHLAR
jgi:hypothetical protein